MVYKHITPSEVVYMRANDVFSLNITTDGMIKVDRTRRDRTGNFTHPWWEPVNGVDLIYILTLYATIDNLITKL